MVWNKISPILLQGYISKGLQNNLDIRIAMQNIVAAATMKQGKAGYLVYLWERTGRIKCCQKTVSLHSFKIGVQINTN
jgi:hypothetical protein